MTKLLKCPEYLSFQECQPCYATGKLYRNENAQVGLGIGRRKKELSSCILSNLKKRGQYILKGSQSGSQALSRNICATSTERKLWIKSRPGHPH